MKEFINRTEDVVEEMMQGLAVLHPSSTRLLGHKVMVRADPEQAHVQQVAVIAGYISVGMLSAAVSEKSSLRQAVTRSSPRSRLSRKSPVRF